MSVGEYCNREVVVTGPDTSITQCAKLMRQHHVGSVIIVEPEQELRIPIGIVTDRDIVIEVVATDTAIRELTVRDMLNRKLVVAREVDGLWETLRRMRNNGVRRIPVVNDEGVLQGLLTEDDLLELLSDELSQLVALVAREKQTERQLRSVP